MMKVLVLGDIWRVGPKNQTSVLSLRVGSVLAPVDQNKELHHPEIEPWTKSSRCILPLNQWHRNAPSGNRTRVTSMSNTMNLYIYIILEMCVGIWFNQKIKRQCDVVACRFGTHTRGSKLLCTIRESNPGPNDGNVGFYH